MKITIVLLILAVFALLRWRKAGALAWALAWWIGFFVALRWGFTTPIPMSVIGLYMGIATLAVLTYVTSSADRRREVSEPIVQLILDPAKKLALAAVVLLLPTLAAAAVWFRMSQPVEAPFFARTVHPASPAEVTVHDKRIDLDRGDNPFRVLQASDPEAYKQHVAAGRRTYYRNCHFCHGDNLSGNGMYVHGLDPIPTDFSDVGNLPNLTETFVFWRISKGAPGLPDEGGPWESAMPVWEKFLTEDEIWDTILFLYDYNGMKPRAKEEVHGD